MPIIRVEAKTYTWDDLQGISKRQLAEHYTLYQGYVNKLNEIQDKLQAGVDLSKANQTYSDLRSLKIGENFAQNGIKLHEAYFENLGVNQEPQGQILQYLENTFGSYEEFKKQFSAVGLAVRGWVVLGVDLDWGILKINGLDAHDLGYFANTLPLLVMDVYEHAYMIDYGIKRADYIESFFKNIAWEVVDSRLKRLFPST